MGFWRSFPGTVLLVLLLAVVTATGVLGAQVWNVLHPTRPSDNAPTLANELSGAEGVRFDAADGVHLAGWLFPGPDDRPSIVLAHDLNESKAALVNLAIALHSAGFTVLAFDFRGHGESQGSVSSLGIDEKRDVLGAVDFVERRSAGRSKEIGVYGSGMGAHAAVLAAADRSKLRVLVLDGIWPDASWPLVRRSYLGWGFGVRWLGFMPRGIYSVLRSRPPDAERAADVLPRLEGRELLFVAPAGDAALASAMQGMYDSLPKSREASEGNLVTLPGTRAAGLDGAELRHYHDRVVQFFESRMVR